MKTTIKTKAISIIITVLLLTGMMPISAFAAQSASPPSYVALGDSISTGYGLADSAADGFTYLLADKLGYDLTNLAVDGNTAAGILLQLENDSVKNAVNNADIITITAGGNDLMALLYQAIADQYNATQTDDTNKITASDVPVIFTSNTDMRRMSLMTLALGLLNPDSDSYMGNDTAFTGAITSYISVLNRVTAGILAENPDATIIVATQYNPYAEFNGAYYQYIIPIDLTSIYAGMESCVTALNTAIKYNATIGNYLVADVKAAFDADTVSDDLYNADAATMNIDFHPSAAGHAVIADAFAKTVPAAAALVTVNAVSDSEYLGTVSGNGTYNIGDSVTLTATPLDEAKFEYWVDAAILLETEPTESELKAAIASYDATYTFTATENVDLTAVFSVPAEISIFPFIITGTDAESLWEAEWIETEDDFGTIILGSEQIVLPGEKVENIITVGDKQYKLAGFIVYAYDEETDETTVELRETFTIDAMPVYGSVEYWDWFVPISDGIYPAYIEYTPEDENNELQPPEPPETPDNTQDQDAPEDQQPSDDPKPQTPVSPQTGDNSVLWMWFALLLASGAGIFVLIINDRKRKASSKK